jgi:cytochrome P450
MVEESKLIWNPFTPGYFQNPYQHLSDCREQNPIQIGTQNSYTFFRYKEVSEMLRSKDFEVSNLSSYFFEKESYIFKNSSQCPYLAKGTSIWPMYLNGTKHKNVRMAMAKSFGSFPLEQVMLEALGKCHEIFRDKNNFNLLDYCASYIYFIVKQLFGINEKYSVATIGRFSNLLAKSQDLFVSRQLLLEINEQFLDSKEMFTDSTFKDVLLKSNELKGISKDELYSIMSIALMAAFETSKDNLSLSLYEIIKNPTLTDKILNASDRKLGVIIEELFRYSAPLQFTIRVNKKAILFNDFSIEKNSKLFLCLASANRDPAVFDQPDELNFQRTPNSHLSFGGGGHFCLGAAIARSEMKYCLKPMVRFLKDFRIDESQEIEWSRQIFMRMAKSIPLVLNNKN